MTRISRSERSARLNISETTRDSHSYYRTSKRSHMRSIACIEPPIQCFIHWLCARYKLFLWLWLWLSNDDIFNDVDGS